VNGLFVITRGGRAERAARESTSA